MKINQKWWFEMTDGPWRSWNLWPWLGFLAFIVGLALMLAWFIVPALVEFILTLAFYSALLTAIVVTTKWIVNHLRWLLYRRSQKRQTVVVYILKKNK
jgi:hypothetical protein